MSTSRAEQPAQNGRVPALDGVPSRADGRRNRERILTAASESFRQKGLDATVPEIAARAGVAKATVYRSFPTKDHLVSAVVRDRTQLFEEMLATAAEQADAWAALCDAFEEILASVAGDQTLARETREPYDYPEVVEARQLMMDALSRLLRAAWDQGRLRDDVSARDVRIMLRGCASVLLADGVTDPAEFRRFASFIARAVAS